MIRPLLAATAGGTAVLLGAAFTWWAAHVIAIHHFATVLGMLGAG